MNKINNLELTLFKNSDHFILKLLNNSYLDISKILLCKYNYNVYKNKNGFLSYCKKKILKFIVNNSKKKIKLYSVDLFSLDFHKSWLKKNLKDKFIIEFTKNNPDYLIYNVFGTEHLNPKYNNSIKIAVLTENKIPDFYEADYAIGHYHISYLDRYFKFSIFFWQNLSNTYFSLYRNEVINNPRKRKFCAALISNNFITDGFRVKFINELNKYKQVDLGGKYNNNVGGPVINKIEFLKSYKFSIAMENTEGNGYISEKIVDSFLAGNIPIYYIFQDKYSQYIREKISNLIKRLYLVI